MFFFVVAANQHIRMISEESCDTEDWSNDAELSALHHRNKLHFEEDDDDDTFYLYCAFLKHTPI